MDVCPPKSSTTVGWLRLGFRGVGLGLGAALLYQFCYVMLGANFRTVEEGFIYRSAQLSPTQLEKVIKQHNIRTLINLRGCCEPSLWYMNQGRVLSACNVSQEDLGCSAGRLPSTVLIHDLVTVLEQSEYPILVHCHRGIDRTGLVVAIALLLRSEMDLDKALEELTIRYAHIPLGKTGNMDRFFAFYKEWLVEHDQPHSRATFRFWLLHEYCPGECLAEITLLPRPSSAPELAANQQELVQVLCRNRSQKTWEFKPGHTAGIHLQFAILDADGNLLHTNRSGLGYASVPPRGNITIDVPIPALKPGRYTLRADLIDEQHASFYQTGSEPLFAEVNVK